MVFFANDFLAEFFSFVAFLAFLAIIVFLGFVFWKSRKSVEEKHADSLLSVVDRIRLSKPDVSSPVVLEGFEIKKNESTLKELLIKKFKPKIELQLSSKVVVLDFNAKENNFLALVEISGVRVLLSLDSSGKIIDYKKVKK
jgi:hypothetical protein